MPTAPAMTPLSEMKPGQGGVIARLEMDMPGHFQKLMSMGVFPGDTITLLHKYPSFVFETGFSQFAVDEAIASRIYVQL